MFMYVSVHAHTCIGWRLIWGIFSLALYLTFIVLFFETGSLTNLKFRFCQISWSGCFRKLPVCLLSVGITGTYCHAWAFYVEPRAPHLGSRAHMESTIQTEWLLKPSVIDHPDWYNSLLTGVPLFKQLSQTRWLWFWKPVVQEWPKSVLSMVITTIL